MVDVEEESGVSDPVETVDSGGGTQKEEEEVDVVV